MNNEIKPYYPFLVRLFYANCGFSGADVVFARNKVEAKRLYEPKRQRLERENMAKQNYRPDINGTIIAEFERKKFPNFVIKSKR